MTSHAPWTCDTCGQPINNASEGWVQWLTRTDQDRVRAKGLILCHRPEASPLRATRSAACYHDENVEFRKDGSTHSDLHLSYFLTLDGLQTLLEMVVSGRFEDPAEVVQMIQRLHIPSYEQAFRHLDAAINAGVFEPNTADGFPGEEQIKLTVEWLEADARSR